jgi:anti-sigma factor RsiW
MDDINECKRFLECLSAHFDGELDEELVVQFEQHLRFCTNARCIVQTFERTIALHRQARPARVPDDVHERLLKVLSECRRASDE